jgi:concanavalin A-like lectin/glucanase superfamily protein/type IX secretion system substrate protein/peptide-N-glycosidase F-like protein
MKFIFTVCLSLLASAMFAQSAGDTIVVPTFNYSQTSGGGIRDTMINFPDNPDESYGKIIMLYNMRCKEGLISVPGNTNRGCGEWDYSCNTYITDSSRVDSVLSFTNSHTITTFSGSTFNYVEIQLYDYYQFLQKNVVVNSIISENLYSVGSGNIQLANPIATANNSGKSQYLYTQTELSSAGLSTGDINAIALNIIGGSSDAEYFKIRIKNTTKTLLDANDPDITDFTEVYFHDNNFTTGENKITFHAPFSWDGSSNIIIEFSFTNNTNGTAFDVEGEETGNDYGIYAHNGYSINSVNGSIDIPTTAFSSISEEITVSFWSYGNEKVQPIHNSILHGVDANNNRQINLHLPWGNSSIYFDCGNDGNGYDRIDKGASASEFKGNWNHWAITKNTTTGDMKMYLNGSLWHSGTDKTKLIDIQEFVLVTSGNVDRSYFGNIDEVRIWDKELSEQVIGEWMYKQLSPSHPNYGSLIAYYNLDEGTGISVSDASPNAETGTINDFLYWVHERGSNLQRGFTGTTQRPNITFAQGNYDLTIVEELVTDSVKIIPNIVREFNIIPRTGTMLNDSINQLSVNEYWESQYEHIFNPEGIAIDSTLVVHTGTIEVEELTYYNRYPSKYEIMSFVTPYGIYLDLGMEGKTWAFDVTDYSPILKGKKRITIERGGQRQEDMDIKFLFVVGTPPHDILNVNQLWRPDSKGFTSIIDNRSFEPRELLFNPEGHMFKFRSVITGHGQQGEFQGRNHTFDIDEGDIEYVWKVWTECSEIAIYPQGGTWVYDRAGWCPGTPSDLYEYDITEHVTAGQTHTLDYGLEYASGTSNYIVNNQLVTYGMPNFTIDAAVVRILKPTSDEASEERFNPACSYPEIVIQNTGSATLSSLDIEYLVEGGESKNHTWNGSLEFLQQDTVVLPIDDLTFWNSGLNRFTVNISNPNDQVDEYVYNNTYSSVFEDLHVYPEGNTYIIQLKTNNFGYQSSYTLKDGSGTLLYERHNCDDNTLYEDDFYLFPGCYEVKIEDSGDNGLEFWHQPNQGVGYFKILDSEGTPLYTFDPDFGGYATFEFGVGAITDIDNINYPFVYSIYPNPASDILSINITGSGNNTVTATISNTVSTRIMEKTWYSNNKETSTDIDISNLPAGIYLLTIKYGNHIRTEKVIKY